MIRKQDFTNCVFYDSENRILLQKRHINSKILPGYWGLFGGKIEKGEKHHEAIVREIKEELNIELKGHKFLFEDYDSIDNIIEGKWFLYSKKASNKEIEKMILLEGVDWGWFSFKDLKQLKIRDKLMNVLNRIRKNIIN